MRLIFASSILLLASCGGNSETATKYAQENPTPPAETLAVNTVEIHTDVYPTPEAAEPLSVGSLVPPVEVSTIYGEVVNLAEVVNDGALLVFYRGGW